MKKLLVIGLGLVLGACAAQQSAMQSQGAQPPETAAAATGDGAADRREDRRRSDRGYVSTLERRDVTGSRINRVQRRGEPAEDTTAGKRVETISGDQLEERGYDSLSEVLPAGD